jgi:predicted restriction endonuclease
MTQFELYRQGYVDSESINVELESDKYADLDDILATSFSQFVSNNDTFECYQIPKHVIDTILRQSVEKRIMFEYGLNEFYIEANACVELCEHLLQNAQYVEPNL